MAMPYDESLALFKIKASIPTRYNSNNPVAVVEEKDFPVQPFATGNEMDVDNTGKATVFVLPKKGYDCQYCYEELVFKTVKGYKLKPEILYVSKIAQLRKAYPDLFVSFTSGGSDWAFPDKVAPDATIDAFVVIENGEPYRPGWWGNILEKDQNNRLSNLYKDKATKPAYFREMLDTLRNYISRRLAQNITFFDTATYQCATYKMVEAVRAASENECAHLTDAKRAIAIRVMTKSSMGGLYYYSESQQEAILKLVKTIPEGIAQSNFINTLSTYDLFGELEANLNNVSDSKNYYERYTEIMAEYISKLDKPASEPVMQAERIFNFINRDDRSTYFGQVEFDGPIIKFAYHTSGQTYTNFKNQIVIDGGVDHQDSAYDGILRVKPMDYILLNLYDDYTVDGEVVFKRADFPKGVMLTGLQLYWLEKVRRKIAAQKFTKFVAGGVMMVIAGPEILTARAWGILLAIGDFQLGFHMAFTTTTEYRNLYNNNPSLRPYLDAWDDINRIYAVARVTQVTAELLVTKWAVLKAEANTLKSNPGSLPTGASSLLKLESVSTTVLEDLFTMIKNNLTRRIALEPTRLTLHYTDAELRTMIESGLNKGIVVPEIEDIIFNGCRNSKAFKAAEIVDQMEVWRLVKQNGYPTIFTSMSQFVEFSNVIKDLATEWGLSVDRLFVQGSTLRITNISAIGDIDIAIKVSGPEFEALVNRFKNATTSEGRRVTITTDAANGKISGTNMFSSTPTEQRSFTGKFYQKFEEHYQMSLKQKFGIDKIQLSIIKESTKLDVSPFLKIN